MRRFLRWLNERFRIVATDEESERFSRVDMEIRWLGQ